MTKLRGILAALGLLLSLVGAPWALLSWGHLPWTTASLRADDGSLLLVALTVIGWLAWLAFALATAAETVTVITGRHHRLPGLGGVQQLASGLLLIIIAALPLSTVAPSDGSTAVTTVPIQPPAPAPEPTATVAAEAAIDDAPTEDSLPTTTDSYTVRAGDDLWSIAEHTLGDGRQWRAIAAVNPGLTDPLSELREGTSLRLPARAATLSAHTTAATEHPSRITVARGDTLSELALEHLGKAARWPKIARANAIITDPDHIEVGWRLTIPGTHRDHQASGGSSAAPEATPQAESAPEPPPALGSHPVDHSQDPAPESRGESTPSAPPTVTEDSSHPALPLTLGTLAATAVVGTLELRRALRLRERPPGRCEPPATPAADRLRTALHEAQRPDAIEALTAVLQLIAAHCHRERRPAPTLAAIRLSADQLTVEWHGSAGAPPPGFGGDDGQWTFDITRPITTDDRPCPYPALVSLGVRDGETLLVDAEQSGVLGVAGSPDQRRAALAAMAVELACAPWSADTHLIVCGRDAGLVKLAGEDRVQTLDEAEALEHLRRHVARRRLWLGDATVGELRVDPARAEAVCSTVFCFLDGLDDALVAEIEELLATEPVGVAVIVATASAAEAQWQVGGPDSRPTGHLAGQPGELAAHVIAEPVRQALTELLAPHDLVSAPWWGEDNVYQLPNRDGEDVDIVRLLQPATHPQLLLIGPAELQNPTGPEPTRSRQQLIELCAWLAEHPGSNASQMAAGLLVAESTRRSNLSRLRTWLGSDPAGEPYLPDAYSGRISLHVGITSDWQQLQLLLKPGITRVSDRALIAALELVRGAPLADAAPTQWHWAEELRVNISAALRDVGVVLTDRALANHDLDLARWAASRALVVAPDDELLLCARLRTEHQAGNSAETERLVNHITRQARLLGVDLLPETIELCQQVIEGRLRARA
ncbi:MAG TPA: LysM peptidoglycan-binding domain-containing protein [Propionicimonas sp.]|nr:LysM peptidoglycan-binding domain-containing protein [Propionicimonas sp.]